jgi:alkylhydroperoxidase family enzyme
MSLGAPSERLTDERTGTAVRLAHAAMADPHAVPDDLWHDLKRQFSDREVVELVFVIGFYRGTQLMIVLLDTDIDPVPGAPGEGT